MDPSSPAAATRHRSSTQILHEAALLYRSCWPDLFRVAAVSLLVSWTVNLVIKGWAVGALPLGALEDPRAPEFFRRIGRVFGAGIANGMVYALLNTLAGGLITLLARRVQAGRGPDLQEELRRLARRAAPLLGATLILFLVLAGIVGLAGLALSPTATLVVLAHRLGNPAASLGAGLAAGLAALVVVPACALAAVLFSLRWALAPCVIVLEGEEAIPALRRSALLTRDDRATPLPQRYLVRAALLMLCLVLLQLVVGGAGALPSFAASLAYAGSPDPAEVSVLNPGGLPVALLIPLELIEVLASALVLPFGVIVFLLLYQDQRDHAEADRRTALRLIPPSA